MIDIYIYKSWECWEVIPGVAKQHTLFFLYIKQWLLTCKILSS